MIAGVLTDDPGGHLRARRKAQAGNARVVDAARQGPRGHLTETADNASLVATSVASAGLSRNQVAADSCADGDRRPGRDAPARWQSVARTHALSR